MHPTTEYDTDLVTGGKAIVQRIVRRKLRAVTGRAAPVAMGVMLLAGLLAAPASASLAPVLTLDQSAGDTAGSTTNLGVDITLSPTTGDTVKDLTLQLPAGLLADAAVDGGACLTSPAPQAACQVGTGTVTATSLMLGDGNVAAALPATFDLVAPPGAGDLAGLALLLLGQPLGAPAAVTVRPSGDPAGVGLDIGFAGIPDTFTALGTTLSISVQSIQATFDGLRYPDSCPATPAQVTVSADSYAAAAVASAGAPLVVTGCGALPYEPAFGFGATRDAHDDGVQISTTITQAPGEATSSSLTLGFPSKVLLPNVSGVVAAKALCADPSTGTCTPVGMASATSPLYPDALSGLAYLTGGYLSPALTIVFPPPFAITLTGQVNLKQNSTTFSGIPDIPLTNLDVTLAGGPAAVFAAGCVTAAGTATASLVSQNADQTASASQRFTVANCPQAPQVVKSGPPKLSSVSFAGLAGGTPAVSFRLAAGTGAAKLSSFTIGLPAGLGFSGRRRHGAFAGVTVRGAHVASLRLSRGRLVVSLGAPAAALSVRLGPTALTERAGLRSAAGRRPTRSLGLKLTVSRGPA